MKKGKFISIRNQASSNTLELYFLDRIENTYDWWSDVNVSKVKEIIDQVNYYKPTNILCYIDSFGGDCQVGLSIYNFLKATSAQIEVKVIGLAGSIASVIAMAADSGKLSIAKNGFMMIHKASGGGYGSSDDLREQADLIDKYSDQAADIYAQRTGKTIDEVKALYEAGDYWMNGDEAVAQGFADAVFNDDAYQIAAELTNSDSNNIPKALKDKLNITSDANPASDPHTLIQNQLTDMKKFFIDMVNSIRNAKPEEGKAETITQQVANAISSPLEKLGEEIETQITSQIKAAKEEISLEFKTSYDEKIDCLEKRNEELVQELAKISGAATNAGGSKTEEKPAIGSFKSGK